MISRKTNYRIIIHSLFLQCLNNLSNLVVNKGYIRIIMPPGFDCIFIPEITERERLEPLFPDPDVLHICHTNRRETAWVCRHPYTYPDNAWEDHKDYGDVQMKLSRIEVYHNYNSESIHKQSDRSTLSDVTFPAIYRYQPHEHSNRYLSNLDSHLAHEAETIPDNH